MYCFTFQTFDVKWCDKLSKPFTSVNGVHTTRGILSAIYFNVFVYDLSRELSLGNVGCYANQSLINNLFYADDTLLLAPSPAALQILLDTCQHYAVGIRF